MFPFPFSFLSGAAPDVPVEQIANAKAMSFNGTDQYVEVSNSTDFDFGTGDFTWSLWVDYKTHVNYSGLLYTGISNSRYRLKFQTSGQILFMQNADGDSQVANLGTNITGTGWHHLCLVRSSGIITTYLDGSAVDTDSRAGNVNSLGSDLIIGRNGSSYFNGQIDEVALFNTALSASKIQQIYDATAVVGGVPQTANLFTGGLSSSLVYWNRMGDS